MTCDNCWENPCTCIAHLDFKISFKRLTQEEVAAQWEFGQSLEGQKLLSKLTLRNFRDTGMIDREDFEARIKEIENGRLMW